MDNINGSTAAASVYTNSMIDSSTNVSTISSTVYIHMDNDEWSMNSNVASLFLEPPRIIALILGFFAISLNVASLLALIHVKNKSKTHLKLVASLAVSDIVIGISVILHFITTAINTNYYPGEGPTKGRLVSRCMSTVAKALNSTGLNICLLNLTGMAIDHYLAITKPLKYLSRNKKSTFFILGMWIVSIVLGFSDFFTGNRVYQRRKPLYNYCEAVFLSLYQDEYTVFFLGLTTSIFMLCIYIRIYCNIRNHQLPGESYSSMHHRCSNSSSVSKRFQQGRRNTNLRRGKALKTTLLILGTFLLCWAPTCLYQIGLIIQVTINEDTLMPWHHALYVLDQYLLDLLLLNAAIDPVIYAIRMQDIQLGYRRMFQKLRFREAPCLKTGSERRVSFQSTQENLSSNVLVTKATELHPLSKTLMKT